ncbi:MAG: hypothetical protein C3F11_12800 [Methylocystaceae bacterium]|nr:MAG: hypothetical protein C3F11_12800 [Methylocystaceae bacterium]
MPKWRQESLGQAHPRLAAIGERRIDAIGLVLVLRGEGEREALEADLFVASAVRTEDDRTADLEAHARLLSPAAPRSLGPVSIGFRRYSGQHALRMTNFMTAHGSRPGAAGRAILRSPSNDGM